LPVSIACASATAPAAALIRVLGILIAGIGLLLITFLWLTCLASGTAAISPAPSPGLLRVLILLAICQLLVAFLLLAVTPSALTPVATTAAPGLLRILSAGCIGLLLVSLLGLTRPVDAAASTLSLTAGLLCILAFTSVGLLRGVRFRILTVAALAAAGTRNAVGLPQRVGSRRGGIQFAIEVIKLLTRKS
jgi:hypothetical protein